jgi:hypothetical protein
MEIELLVVPNCPNEAAAHSLIRSAMLGTDAQGTRIRTTVISTEQEADARGFTGSPTILVNGSDPFEEPRAAVGLACRVYPTPDGPRGVPGLAGLRHAVIVAAAG